MTVTEQVLQLTRQEKLKVMEALWADLSRGEEDYESPSWHERELKQTRARYEQGDEPVLDWKEAKKRLRE